MRGRSGAGGGKSGRGVRDAFRDGVATGGQISGEENRRTRWVAKRVPRRLATYATPKRFRRQRALRVTCRVRRLVQAPLARNSEQHGINKGCEKQGKKLCPLGHNGPSNRAALLPPSLLPPSSSSGPTWPWLLRPKARASPPAPITTEWLFPDAIHTVGKPARDCTGAATLRSVPSPPTHSPTPQENNWCRMSSDGMGWDGMEWDGMGGDKMRRGGRGGDGMGWDECGHCRRRCCCLCHDHLFRGTSRKRTSKARPHSKNRIIVRFFLIDGTSSGGNKTITDKK